MKFKNKIRKCYNSIVILFISCSSVAFVACSNKEVGKTGFDGNNQTDSSVIAASNLSMMAELNVKMKETSGLALLENVLITHNDKGRSNELMLVNPENGTLIQSIAISNIQNNDWEDVAKNEEFLFIGDVGNNEGERKNLTIHLVPLKTLNKNNTVTQSVGSINFFYPDQKEFDVSKKHNFDCEAILYYNNQLYLFTKNRLDDKTNLYVLPSTPGNYEAKYVASFEVGGRITGADISKDGKKIALIGYNKKTDCFLWTFESFLDNNFFKGQSKKYTLGPYKQLGQMEGIAFKDNSLVFISSEEIAKVHARLYLFKLD
jgi:hypothetical protein